MPKQKKFSNCLDGSCKSNVHLLVAHFQYSRDEGSIWSFASRRVHVLAICVAFGWTSPIILLPSDAKLNDHAAVILKIYFGVNSGAVDAHWMHGCEHAASF